MIHVATSNTRRARTVAHAAPLVLRRAMAALLAACALHALLADAAGPFAMEAARAKPVQAGELAPDFTLPDQDGRPHTLSTERGRRAVVLAFYRGHW